MATFAVLKAQIADDLSRTDLTSQIETAVLDAITFYERKRFYFNESRTLTVTTVAAQEFYDEDDAAGIPTLLSIDVAKISITTTDVYALEVIPYDTLEEISQNTTLDAGQPSYLAYYNQTIRLYPVPTAAWTLRISGVRSLTALSAAGDQNAWTTDARDLIRARAKWDLYTHVIKDFEQADRMSQAEQLAFTTLRGATMSRSASGLTMQATQF